MRKMNLSLLLALSFLSAHKGFATDLGDAFLEEPSKPSPHMVESSTDGLDSESKIVSDRFNSCGEVFWKFIASVPSSKRRKILGQIDLQTTSAAGLKWPEDTVKQVVSKLSEVENKESMDTFLACLLALTQHRDASGAINYTRSLDNALKAIDDLKSLREDKLNLDFMGWINFLAKMKTPEFRTASIAFLKSLSPDQLNTAFLKPIQDAFLGMSDSEAIIFLKSDDPAEMARYLEERARHDAESQLTEGLRREEHSYILNALKKVQPEQRTPQFAAYVLGLLGDRPNVNQRQSMIEALGALSLNDELYQNLKNWTKELDFARKSSFLRTFSKIPTGFVETIVGYAREIDPKNMAKSLDFLMPENPKYYTKAYCENVLALIKGLRPDVQDFFNYSQIERIKLDLNVDHRQFFKELNKLFAVSGIDKRSVKNALFSLSEGTLAELLRAMEWAYPLEGETLDPKCLEYIIISGRFELCSEVFWKFIASVPPSKRRKILGQIDLQTVQAAGIKWNAEEIIGIVSKLNEVENKGSMDKFLECLSSLTQYRDTSGNIIYTSSLENALKAINDLKSLPEDKLNLEFMGWINFLAKMKTPDLRTASIAFLRSLSADQLNAEFLKPIQEAILAIPDSDAIAFLKIGEPAERARSSQERMYREAVGRSRLEAEAERKRAAEEEAARQEKARVEEEARLKAEREKAEAERKRAEEGHYTPGYFVFNGEFVLNKTIEQNMQLMGFENPKVSAFRALTTRNLTVQYRAQSKLTHPDKIKKPDEMEADDLKRERERKEIAFKALGSAYELLKIYVRRE